MSPRPTTSGRRSRAGRLLAGGGVLVSMVCFAVAALTVPAAAAGESLSVSPSSGLVDGQSVSVSLTTTAATEATVFIGVTQCGNATSAGTPLAVAGENDCMGAAGLGTSLVTIGATGAGGLTGPVPAGPHQVTLKLKKTGIGTNGAQCIPLDQALIPCRVSASTATFAGGYTGPGYNFVATTDITYGTPTTTTVAPTTTAGPTTTVVGPTTTVVGPTTTVVGPTTTVVGPTTTSTLAPTTTIGGPTTTAAPTTSTTAGPTTTSTRPATTTTAVQTKTFDCTDIPLPAGGLVLSKNRCLAPGEKVTVSAPAGSFPAPASAFVVECNPDPAIPTDGSGCNIGGLGVGAIGADGALAATDLVIATGTIGTDSRSVCPPSQAQADAGVLACVLAAAPNGDTALAQSGAFTVAGQTVVLPVDGSGNPSTSTTAPGGSGAKSDAEVLGTSSVAQATTTGTLPYTGLGGNIWFIVGLAVLLLDVGAVATSIARRQTAG